MTRLTRRSILAASAALAFARPIPLSAQSSGTERPALPIPPEIRADANGQISLTAQSGQMSFLSGTSTPTLGINGNYLGPTVRVRRGDNVTMSVTNTLDQDLTMHWHGAIVPGDVDGGPHSVITPGSTWLAPLEIAQPAATIWYHPHVYPTTAELVVRGLAGLFLIDDDESDQLGLPSRYGIDDIPLVLQDRRFQPDGQIFHRMNLIAVTTGYFGDVMLVNGARAPIARTAQGWLRFRILDGSNARNYNLAASDGRSLYVIASDGGLLEAPVEVKVLPIHAGERFEVLIDARDGTPFDLVTEPVQQPIMRLPPFDETLSIVSIVPELSGGYGGLPDHLAALPAIPTSLPAVSQDLVATMSMDQQGMAALRNAGLMGMSPDGPADPNVVARVVSLFTDGPALSEQTQLAANGINGVPFSLQMTPFPVPRGQALRWSISEGSDQMAHPIHIHGCQFRVVRYNDGSVPAYLAGWKDTVNIESAGSAEVLVTFPFAAPANFPYMAHCHVLEHEDSGMMTQFSVS